MPLQPQPFIVIKLKPGWVLDKGSVTRRGLGLVTVLPPGCKLMAALPLPPPARGRKRSAAERELQRFVHLQLYADAPVAEVLALARGWAFVERAELPPAEI